MESEEKNVGIPTREDVTVEGEAPAAKPELDSQPAKAAEESASPEKLQSRLAEVEQELQRKEADLERLRKIGSKKANENFQLRKQAATVAQLQKDVESLGHMLADALTNIQKESFGEYEETRPKRNYRAEVEESFKKNREATSESMASPEVEELFGYVKSVGLQPNDKMVLDSIVEAGGDPEFALEKLQTKVAAFKAVPPAKAAAKTEADIEALVQERVEKLKAELLQPGARQPVTPGALSSKDIEEMDMDRYAQWRQEHPNA